MAGKLIKHLHGLMMETLALRREPFLKGETSHTKAGQQIASVQLGCFFESLDTRVAALDAAMLMLLPGGNQVHKGPNIQPIAAVWIELDSATRNLQTGTYSVSVLNDVTQPVQCLTKGVKGLYSRLIRPQQIGQYFSAKGGPGVQRQIGQQGPCPVGLELGDRVSVMLDLEGTQ
jgi:hypothetical protein